MKTDGSKIISQVEELIAEGELKKALGELYSYFEKAGLSEKKQDVVILQGRLATLEKEHMISGASIDADRNKIAVAVLALAREIDPAASEKPAKAVPVYPKGKLLHNIPRRMKLGEYVECKTRIAHTQKALLSGFEKTPDTAIRTIPKIGKIMEVCLKSLESDAFEVVSVSNEPSQRVFRDTYTEWTFYVRPLKSGRHRLVLDIALLVEMEDGSTKRHETFSEEIDVTTDADVVAGSWQTSAYLSSAQVVYPGEPFWKDMSYRNPILYKSVVVMAIVGSAFLGGTLGYWIPPIVLPPDPVDEQRFAVAENRYAFQYPTVFIDGRPTGFRRHDSLAYVLCFPEPDIARALGDTMMVYDTAMFDVLRFAGVIDTGRIIPLWLVGAVPVPKKPEIPLPEKEPLVPPPPAGPCRSYLKIDQATAQTLEIQVGSKYDLPAHRVGPGLYRLEYCDWENPYDLTCLIELSPTNSLTCSANTVTNRKYPDTLVFKCANPVFDPEIFKEKQCTLFIQLTESLKNPVVDSFPSASYAVDNYPAIRKVRLIGSCQNIENHTEYRITGNRQSDDARCECTGRSPKYIGKDAWEVEATCQIKAIPKASITVKLTEEEQAMPGPEEVRVDGKPYRNYRKRGHNREFVINDLPRGNNTVRLQLEDANWICEASAVPDRPSRTVEAKCRCKTTLVSMEIDKSLLDFQKKLEVQANGKYYSTTIQQYMDPIFVPTKTDKTISLALKISDDQGNSRSITVCSETIRAGSPCKKVVLKCAGSNLPPNVKISQNR